MSRQGRPPKIDVDALCRAYSEFGVITSYLMERFGVNQSTIYYHLRRRGVWNGKTRRQFCRKAKQRFIGKASPCIADMVCQGNRIIERVEVLLD